MKGKLAILLATYNSSKYLREQLDSLFNQTNKNWILYVRDDGSSDCTLEIIEEYKVLYKNIILISDSESGLGAMRSFLRLLETVHSDYYMFCDHDDVWLPNKISLSLDAIGNVEFEFPHKPIIVHTDLTVVNESLEVVNSSFWKMSAIKPEILESKKYIQVFNCVTGCTMIFNSNVKKLAFPFVNEVPMHDWWLALQTIKNDGIVKHLDNKTILYRQHGKNEVGARSVGGNYFVNKILKLGKTLQGQAVQINFLKKINGLNTFQYYYYKLSYTLLRKL